MHSKDSEFSENNNIWTVTHIGHIKVKKKLKIYNINYYKKALSHSVLKCFTNFIVNTVES